jgi:ubiquitin-activating enzyme E1
LGSQFFLREQDIGQTRALSSLKRIQELNYYVPVDVVGGKLDPADLSVLKGYTVVVLTDASEQLALSVDKYCREQGILFLWAGIFGVFGFTFVDFGPSFEVFDKDGSLSVEVFF